MTDQIAFLKDLISAPGLSGYEDPAARIIEDKWRPFVHEISRSKLGSLHGLRHGTGQVPRLSVMVATHMDAIGLMVTGITECLQVMWRDRELQMAANPHSSRNQR